MNFGEESLPPSDPPRLRALVALLKLATVSISRRRTLDAASASRPRLLDSPAGYAMEPDDRLRTAVEAGAVGKVVAMVGVFGAGMALFGSVAAMLAGGTGTLAGADEASAVTMRGLGALVAAAAGLAGALAGRTRLALGAALMLASSAVGLILITWYYAAGAILFLTASVLALRPGPGGPHSTL